MFLLQQMEQDALPKMDCPANSPTFEMEKRLHTVLQLRVYISKVSKTIKIKKNLAYYSIEDLKTKTKRKQTNMLF